MAFEVTVKQCAEMLGITEARVYQLIKEGLLPAESIAGRYFIDEYAVESRAASNVSPGRPRKKKPRDCRHFTLMNRTHEVLRFAYDIDAGEFSQIEEVFDLSRAPLGLVSPRGRKVSLSSLAYWWKHRTIPMSRKGIEAKLSELGLSDASSLPFANLGLSFSDQYWILPDGSELDWRTVNYFNNSFPEMASSDWLEEVGLHTPDNTSEGQLSKRWVTREGAPVLLKGGGALNQEPYNEVVATALHSRLLLRHEFVAYKLDALPDGETVSSCNVFLADNEEYIPAYYVMKAVSRTAGQSDYEHYLKCCSKLGIENVEQAMAKMIVVDDILGNHDRHLRNFGLIRNVETMEYRVAPLFDSGSSLLCDKSSQALMNGDMAFKTKPFFEEPNQQLRLVRDYSWLDLESLVGFGEEAFDILMGNPSLGERVSHIKHFIERRISRLRVIAS